MHSGHSEMAIEAEGLGKRFGIRWVLRGVTLNVRKGEAVALRGSNGSGKSTVLRILGTLLQPNAGAANVNGRDVVGQASSVRLDVGYLAHTPGLYDDLTARENLEFAADMLGLSHSVVQPTLGRVGLGGVTETRVRGFSAGMQRRLALARLMMRTPKVLLLDEPYSNLDESGIALVNEVIRDVMTSGGAALLALHELAPAKGIIDRTLNLADGRISTNDTALLETV